MVGVMFQHRGGFGLGSGPWSQLSRTLAFVRIGHHVLWTTKEYTTLQPYIPHTVVNQLDAHLLCNEGDARNNHWGNEGNARNNHWDNPR
jgi:hypothetical protein